MDMLFVYYDTEKPLSLDIASLCRKIVARSEEEKSAAIAVLDEFFVSTPAGWYHDRCEEEIAKFRDTKTQASAAGKASAAARAERRRLALEGAVKNTNGNSTTVERPLNDRATEAQQISNTDLTNQEPRTKNQEPEKTNTPIPPTGGEIKEKKSAISLKTYVAECKALGVSPIPEDDAVFDYIEKVGIPQSFLRLQWLHFKETYFMPEAKRYKSWKTVFLKSVKGNWFKIWYVQNDGSYVLTTVGHQAERQHKDEE